MEYCSDLGPILERKSKTMSMAWSEVSSRTSGWRNSLVFFRIQSIKMLGAVAAFVFLSMPLVGCAPQSVTNEAAPQYSPPELVTDSLFEIPPPDGPWRPHRVSWCQGDGVVDPNVEQLLGLCAEYFREGSGSDGMLELELALEKGQRHPLLLITLGQLYTIAGQGEPDLLPPEGPAADVGDWTKNKKRLLGRAELLLLEAQASRPEDAAVDYLLADVARAWGNTPAAHALVAAASDKCTSGRGFIALVLYQQLNRYPGRYLGGPGPEYPVTAQKKHITGEVIVDLLISPSGAVRQAVVVESPDFSLSQAAVASLQVGKWDAARLGKYPIWSWLRVNTSFTLDQ